MIIGDHQTNTYLLYSDKNNVIIIDPADNAGDIINVIRKNGATIKKILITHGHYDHIGACADIVERYYADVYIHEKDYPMISDYLAVFPRDNYFLQRFRPTKTKNFVKSGDIITLDDIYLVVQEMPGHTDGSVMYISEDIIFSGDTLFMGTVGATQSEADFVKLKHSLSWLLTLKNDYAVLSGHGNQTMLSTEMSFNPYLK